MDDKYLPLLLEMKGDISEIKQCVTCLPDHEQRIRTLEAAPAKKQKGAWAFVKSSALVLMGALFGLLARFIK
jgi:hypothetical protein